MRTARYLLIGAVACATMVIGAQAAFAKTWDVPTSDDDGHAEFSLTAVGGVSDVSSVAKLRACDDEKDGAGVVAFAFDGVRLLEDVSSRGGEGTCGKAKEIEASDTYLVKVCRHDKSEDGPLDLDDVILGNTGDDPALKDCNVDGPFG
jgi:hypothetical protein